jgi:hypothetical protein
MEADSGILLQRMDYVRTEIRGLTCLSCTIIATRVRLFEKFQKRLMNPVVGRDQLIVGAGSVSQVVRVLLIECDFKVYGNSMHVLSEHLEERPGLR